MLTEAPANWIEWHFRSRIGLAELDFANQDERFFYLRKDRARLPFQPSGFVEIDLSSATSSLVMDHELTTQELLHPGMASTAAAVAWWNGHLALHGSAAYSDSENAAIGFLGDRGRGKSSTVAWLRSHGWESVSDDVLVLDEADVLAGPRIVDLREATASAWDMGVNVGRLGQRERWRLTCGDVPSSTPIKALVDLRWGDAISIEPLSVGDRFGLYVEHNILRVEPLNHRALLRFLGIPMFSCTRPKDLSLMDVVMDALLSAVGCKPG